MADTFHYLVPRGGKKAIRIGGSLKALTRVAVIFLSIGKKKCASPCILQTQNWKPKEGDLVMFERQPETVDDTFLYATLLSGAE